MRSALFFFAEFFLLFFNGVTYAIEVRDPGESSLVQDTVFIRKGHYKLSKKTSITVPRDTFYIIPHKKAARTDTSSYQDSKDFYDTVYKKFSRKKFTHLLYYLAFVTPKQSELPDSLQVLKSAGPFEKFRGKAIRNIDVKILSPFGPSVYDMGRSTEAGIGKVFNGVHVNTRKYVIRKHLLFKKGDRVIPAILADNERLLRNIKSIDNARIIAVRAGARSDSVDLLVVVKDVWSIGLDVPLITPKQVRFRLYDANFLGLGDQLTTSMTVDLYRAPFYMFEGSSYTFSNLWGSLIDATIGYTADIKGNSSLLFRFDRPFLTNMTKWAGGTYASWESNVNELTDTTRITSYYKNEGLWLGSAFLLEGQKEPSRLVIATAVYRRHYTSRPIVTIDSNRRYYNQLQVLTTFSISKNYYYLTDYLIDFGKTENLPYGHLFQLTVGPDQSDFYRRLYSGIHLSAGNFFNRFGYISAYVKFGGFFNHSSFEDAVVKFNLNYFTPLYKTPDKRYKFRTFFTVDYRHAFNSRSNNRDYYDANLNFKISKVSDADYFNVVNVLSGRLSSVCFTPLFFYGFRFAVMMEVQAGLVAQRAVALYKAPLFSSIGLSIIIKNNNLVFPPFLISGYFYPSTLGNFRHFQYILNSNLNIQYYDFNVTAPHEENLGN